MRRRSRPAEADFGTEPLIVWRAWALASHQGRLVLAPILDKRPWAPRTSAHARCARRRHHRAPSLGCTCGLYGASRPELLQAAQDPAVIGLVALWGHVIEHEQGFRGEWAYPQALRLVCPHCLWQRGAEAASPEVLVRREDGRPVPLCRRHLELSHTCGVEAHDLEDARTVESELLDTYAIDRLAA